MTSENPSYYAKLKKHKKLLISGVVLFAGMAWFSCYVWYWEHRESLLEVYFFDMAHGMSVFVRAPDGRTVLIGGGQGSEILRKLTEVMPFYRRHIDVVVVPVAVDSLPGLVDVLSRYRVDNVYRFGMSTTTFAVAMPFPEKLEIGQLDDTPVLLSASGGMLRLSYGRSSFLIADSLTRKEQQEILLTTVLQETEVLQLRSTASARVSSNFVTKVSPKYFVTVKMPSRPKAKEVKMDAEIIEKVVVPTKLTKKKKPSVKTSKAIRVQKPPPDPPFDLYSLPKNVKPLALDREGAVEFISDGIKLWLAEGD